MPIDYSKYPPNWLTEIRPAILKRAGQILDDDGNIEVEACCEICKLKNHTWYHRIVVLMPEVADPVLRRDNGGSPSLCALCGEKHHKPVQLVLTVAHLDHDETNHDVQLDRLAALCQKCHLAYDAPEKRRRKDENRGQGQLFDKPHRDQG